MLLRRNCSPALQLGLLALILAFLLPIVAAALSAVQNSVTAPQSQSPAAAPQPAQPNQLPATAQQQAQEPVRRFLVLVDPAHGGDDRGAVLTPTLVEKDVTLALARRLRNALESRGIAVSLLREADAGIRLDQRAAIANNGRESLVITLHAAASGSAVRVITSRLLPRPDAGSFLPWSTAQTYYLRQSRSVAEKLLRELRARKIEGLLFPASLRPLNSIARPAIAIEVPPPQDEVETVTAAAYQQQIAAAIAAAVDASRSSLEASR